MNQLAESHYASSKREPLGKSIVRNYKFPEQVKENNFLFGIPTTGFFNAKELIYNGSLLKEPDDVKKLYYKTHGLTDPGNNQRFYKWDFDPKVHKFGYFQKQEMDGVKKSLMADNLYNPYPQTRLVGKRLEDYRQATNDLLGKSKFFRTLNPKFYENHTFGKKCQLGDEWNAGRCIHGDESTVTPNSVSADVDLGKDYHNASKIKNSKPSERDLNRTYGIPSIRKDLLGQNKRISMVARDNKTYFLLPKPKQQQRNLQKKKI